jgi:hypothetical protein
MHTGTPTADAAATAGLLVEGGIAAVAAILCGGILLAALALPLEWLPGQLPLTVLLLLAVPLTMVRLFRQRTQLHGLAANAYCGRGGGPVLGSRGSDRGHAGELGGTARAGLGAR